MAVQCEEHEPAYARFAYSPLLFIIIGIGGRGSCLETVNIAWRGWRVG